MSRLIFVLLVMCSTNIILGQSNVGIGTSNPDASALLDMNSSNRGVLFPRIFLTNINTPAPVSAPTTGLLIWNTNADVTGGSGIGYYFWNVIKWEKISANLSNLWVADPTGMHNQSGTVGIGTNSVLNIGLSVLQVPTGGAGSAALDLYSSDTWHTVIRFRNLTMDQEWQMMVGGSGNIDQIPGSFGIFNTNPDTWGFTLDQTTNFMSIGSYTHKAKVPKSRVHVFNGDVNIEDIGRGIIMKSPNGSCWRITIDDAGNLIRTAIACP
jgi:hypothetical protein